MFIALQLSFNGTLSIFITMKAHILALLFAVFILSAIAAEDRTKADADDDDEDDDDITTLTFLI